VTIHLTRRQVIWSIVAVVVAFSVAALAAAAFVSAFKATEIRDAQLSNTKTLRNTERTLDLIEDCTTPGRDCYDRGQKRTADAVANINKVAVYAAACADRRGVQGRAEIFTCVIRALAQEDRKR